MKGETFSASSPPDGLHSSAALMTRRTLQKHSNIIFPLMSFCQTAFNRELKWPTGQILWWPKMCFSSKRDYAASNRSPFFVTLFKKYLIYLPPRSAQKVISQPTPDANEVSIAFTKFPKNETICISLRLVKHGHKTRFYICISKLHELFLLSKKRLSNSWQIQSYT